MFNAKMSNYPGGFVGGILIRGMPLQVAHPGKIFWVSNASAAMLPGQRAGSDGNQGTFNDPFATLDYAIGRCQAGRGDIIMIKPGHAENVSAASGITVDVAGIAIIGLGTGTLRPKFTFTATSSTYVISAANVTHYNVVWEAGIADVVIGLDVSGVDGLSFINCETGEGAVAGTFNFVDVIDLATGADDIYFEGMKMIGNDTNNDAFITGVAHDGFVMKNCYLASNVAQAAAHGLVDSSGNVTNVWIDNCAFRSNIDGALWVDFNGAANGGLITNCNVSSIDTAGAQNTVDFTGGHVFNCRFSGEADAWGLEGGGGAVYNNA